LVAANGNRCGLSKEKDWFIDRTNPKKPFIDISSITCITGIAL